MNKRWSKKTLQNTRDGYLFIGLFCIGFIAFTIIPILSSLVYSFCNYNVITPPKFAGLKNYQTLISDTKFWLALKVTSKYVVFSVPLKLLFSLAIAMLLYKTNRVTAFYRAAFYLPSIIGGSVAIAIVWRQVFSGDGMLNTLFNSIFGADLKKSWIGSPDTAIWTLIILSVWQYGSSMLNFLSGLKQIPPTYYEAASIDGASPIQRFFRITLPLLTPTIFFNLVMQIILALTCFTQSLLITRGEPMGLTKFSAVYMYETSFKYSKMGYGCAQAWVLLVLIATITIVLFRSQRYWVYYETDVKEEK
ncbi:MAG: sugar ABC transporter permease [Oscillospiraceae bacterium]|nr:sugar ABC transporter permease [Oscillospiraceae bacterium]